MHVSPIKKILESKKTSVLLIVLLTFGITVFHVRHHFEKDHALENDFDIKDTPEKEQHGDPTTEVLEKGYTTSNETIKSRVEHLRAECLRHSDPFRPESTVLTTKPISFGSEVVYIHGRKNTATICIPHKVGSHAWGKFATTFNNKQYLSIDEQKQFLSLNFESRASKSVRVIVVRHPLERLLSVHQMIFEDWCNKDRWLAKQWNNICSEDAKTDLNTLSNSQKSLSGSFNNNIEGKDGRRGSNEKSKFSADNFLKSMIDEQRHGNDRYIKKIWRKFHPEEKPGSSKMEDLRFTFKEFARFIVNGSLEFAYDKYVINHRGLSYHWAPYWKECNVCSETTLPHFIIHLDTLKEDLVELIKHIQGGFEVDENNSIADSFPHTHSSKSSNGSEINDKKLQTYFSTLTKGDIQELYDKYRLDHELFGYTIDQFLQYAQKD